MNNDLFPNNRFLTDEEMNYETVSFPMPRQFQIDAHEKLREGAKNGHRCQIIMAATGAGKSYLAMRIMYEALKKGKRALFICDRTTLINQTSSVADSYGLAAHGIIQAQNPRANRKHRLQIASIQTLARREWPQADVVIIDEIHCQYKSWIDYVNNCSAHVIGLSATPFSKGLGKLFSNLINAATMHDLTESGVLVPMVVYSCTRINMKGAKTAIGGEWADSEVATRGMEIVGDVVSEWAKLASDRKTIVFGATIEHCEVMAENFNRAGFRTEVFTCNTKPDEREILLEEFRKPDSKIRILISVEALAKGFDQADVGAICDCRPLRKSLSTAIQMWGRGLRSSPGKKDCRLLDFSGNILRFRKDFEHIYFNGLDELDSGERLDKTVREDDKEEKEPSKCPKCEAVPFFKKCMACGYQRPLKSKIEHLPGEMKEIRIGKKKSAESQFNIYQMCCGYVRKTGKHETRSQRAFYLYKGITGKNPTWEFKSTQPIALSNAVKGKITARNIAYHEKKKKERA